MKTFKHHNARSLKKAATLLSKYDGKAKVNAGGTDLLGGLRDSCVADYPEAVINIKNIPGLNFIKAGSKGLRIGALTTLADLLKSPAVIKDYPLLAEATHSVASPNLRNMATVGGNLAQDVRCWYYRYPLQIGGPIVCLRKGGRTCSALLGDNRYHSIFGAAAANERRCAGHCPAHINIPEYLRHVRKGDIAEAARILLQYNPIPAITGRVCPIFCEPQCNRGEFDDPVAIHSVERGVGDFILTHAGDYFVPPKNESGKRVSIVGSGPAGLAAAYYLRRSGHRVTVFERMPEAGGMLLYSIPPFRLPKEVVRKQIKALQLMGIQFEVGAEIGHARTIRQLQENSDAVFLAGGTWSSLKLGVPGEGAANVWHALDYLRRVNSGEKVVLGRRVLVVGGGSVAVDVARTARRLGSEEVHLVCLETRDLTSRDRMPALDPEIAEAEEEGIIIHPSLGIREIIAEGGSAIGIRTKLCTSVREPDGRFNPKYDESSGTVSLHGECVVVAIGQVVDPSLRLPDLSDGTNRLFAGGDMTSGPSTVIQAVASAHKAVQEIEALLSGGVVQVDASRREPEYAESCFESIRRVNIPEIPAAIRVESIDVEAVPGLSMDALETEAKRCVSCGCLAVGPSDLAIALVALDASIVTTKRTLTAKAFFMATATCSTVLEPDELIKEIQIPKPPRGARQSYRKFTLRKPLDFAVVSVASIITSQNGICSDARITLGAVAPAPLRASAAEDAIKGRLLTEALAMEAAGMALDGATPLSMNAYKAEIARVLVKRSILGIPD
jgi:NADPH-dependent glutamate synthase beta subunit-like oxidoreductase